MSTPPTSQLPNDSELPTKFIDFLNSAWTRYHAVGECKIRLKAAGFTELFERDSWSSIIKPGGKYYFDRVGSSLVAWAVGAKYVAGNGLIVIGCHTDSPHLKLKPTSKKTSKGMLQMAIQTYGGGLWSTWFDRDLGLGGCVLFKNADGKIEQKLVRIARPLCRIPMLAVHLDRGTGTKIDINTENHLPAILCSAIKDQLLTPAPSEETKSSAATAGTAAANHHSVLLNLVAAEVGTTPENIVDFDLQLCDVQPSTIGGVHNEFILSGRLDNLFSVFCGVTAMCDTATDEALANESSIRMLCAYHHEEIGSRSHCGAAGTITSDAVRRITIALTGNAEASERACQASMLVSSDMAHAVHPNYASKHESAHGPELQKGVVIKTNANQRYATTAMTSSMFKKMAEMADSPIQEFVVRQDMGCGSTIGPIVSSAAGLPTVDVGAPQFAMHSIREMAGCEDVIHKVRIMRSAYNNYTEIDAQFCHVCSM